MFATSFARSHVDRAPFHPPQMDQDSPRGEKSMNGTSPPCHQLAKSNQCYLVDSTHRIAAAQASCNDTRKLSQVFLRSMLTNKKMKQKHKHRKRSLKKAHFADNKQIFTTNRVRRGPTYSERVTLETLQWSRCDHKQKRTTKYTQQPNLQQSGATGSYSTKARQHHAPAHEQHNRSFACGTLPCQTTPLGPFSAVWRCQHQ